jgi:predicted GIY-YIG superfamily endonuclease
LAENKAKQYIYIVQASLEPSKCKIGKTNDLERRLKEYNNMTGKSKDNIYQYLFTCEVKNMTKLENDIKQQFGHMREEENKEIYFHTSHWFGEYVKFIKSHKAFAKEIGSLDKLVYADFKATRFHYEAQQAARSRRNLGGNPGQRTPQVMPLKSASFSLPTAPCGTAYRQSSPGPSLSALSGARPRYSSLTGSVMPFFKKKIMLAQ